MFAGLGKPTELIVIVVTRLSYGCPVQAIIHTFGLDERTVARWRDRAGKHCEYVHHMLVEQGQLDLVHVQADDISVKGSKMSVWTELALMVSTRLWLAGTVSLSRDKRLADRLMQAAYETVGEPCVRWCVPMALGPTPPASDAPFAQRSGETTGCGRACLRVGPQLYIGTVINHTVNKRVAEITRRLTHGTLEQVAALLRTS